MNTNRKSKILVSGSGPARVPIIHVVYSKPCSIKMRRAHGFTLIEMIVATFLLAVGIVGTMQAISSSTQATAVAEEVHTAALLGQKHLTEIELTPDTLSSGDQQGDFGDQFPTYRWKQSVEATDYPNLFQVTVTVQWSSGSSLKERVFTTYLRNDTTTIAQQYQQSEQQEQQAVSQQTQTSQTGGTGSGQGTTGQGGNGG